MKTNPYAGLYASRQTVYDHRATDRTDASLVDVPDFYRKRYPYMLIEDAARSLLYRGLGQRATITLDPADPALEDMIAAAIGERGAIDHLAAAVDRFLERCASSIIALSDTSYEIVYYAQTVGGMPVHFRLEPIQPQTFYRRKGEMRQRITAETASELKRPREIALAPENILTFCPPTYLGGHLRTVVEQLAALSEPSVPDFAIEAAAGHPRAVPFDLAEYKRATDIAVADAAKEIGWTARWSFDERMTDYYKTYRRLEFERFKIEMRETIATNLNAGLARVGRRMGFAACVVIQGVPTLADVTAAREQLERGDRPLGAIMQPFTRG